MLIVRQYQKKFKLSSSILQFFLRRKSDRPNSSSDDIAWSTGEKERPVSWRHDPDTWYQTPKHLIYPHKLDPKDPEQKYPYTRSDGGIQYHNFVYYPRYPGEGHKELKEVTPLFMVLQTNTTRYRPYWEKDIMEQLGFRGRKNGQVVVVKNIPEMNALLWQVKHLVKVLPLKIPKDLHKEANPLHCFINEDGVMEYNPSIKLTEKDLEKTESITDVDYDWINDQTRKIYHNSVKVEF